MSTWEWVGLAAGVALLVWLAYWIAGVADAAFEDRPDDDF